MLHTSRPNRNNATSGDTGGECRGSAAIYADSYSLPIGFGANVATT
jgi:hypothetical protein